MGVAEFDRSDESISAMEDPGFARDAEEILHDVDRHVVKGRRIVSESDASLPGLVRQVDYDHGAKGGLE